MGTGQIRGYLKCNEEVNNTEYVLFHCPSARFILDILSGLIIIILGTKLSIDVRASLINYYKIKRELDTKKNRKYCDTLMIIARRAGYSMGPDFYGRLKQQKKVSN